MGCFKLKYYVPYEQEIRTSKYKGLGILNKVVLIVFIFNTNKVFFFNQSLNLCNLTKFSISVKVQYIWPTIKVKQKS